MKESTPVLDTKNINTTRKIVVTLVILFLALIFYAGIRFAFGEYVEMGLCLVSAISLVLPIDHYTKKLLDLLLQNNE